MRLRIGSRYITGSDCLPMPLCGFTMALSGGLSIARNSSAAILISHFVAFGIPPLGGGPEKTA
jgi:hypothetical protein